MRRQRLHAGARGLGALGDEMLAEEIAVGVVLVEVLGREHDREHRDAAVELHAHQAVDDGAGDELVPVDAAVDHQRAAHDGGVPTGARQALGQQRDFKSAGHGEALHGWRRRAAAEARQLVGKAIVGARHDVGVPAGLDEGDGCGGCKGLIHESLLKGTKVQ